jgi:hypothetical protein
MCSGGWTVGRVTCRRPGASDCAQGGGALFSRRRSYSCIARLDALAGAWRQNGIRRRRSALLCATRGIGCSNRQMMAVAAPHEIAPRFPGDDTYCRPAICPPPHRHAYRTPHTAPHNVTIISILIASDIKPQSSRKTIMARPRQRPAPAIYYRALNSPRPHYFSRRHASISPATRVCRVWYPRHRPHAAAAPQRRRTQTRAARPLARCDVKPA